MAAREVIAGISLSGTVASLAVLEHRSDQIELLFLDEHERTENDELWYLAPLDRFLAYSRTKIHQVSVALDAAELTIIHCPIDTTLTQPERNEQVNWEFSHYVRGYRAGDYINDVHVLDSRAQDQLENTLAVAVRRSVIFGMQDALDQRKLTLGVVDVNHFSTDNTILRNHPEVEKATFVSLGFGQSRIEASVLRNGHMVEYRYSGEDEAAFLRDALEDSKPAGVFLSGVQLVKEREKLARSMTKVPVHVLNPFRRILISHDFPSFTRFAANVHRFAASVGIALRRS